MFVDDDDDGVAGRLLVVMMMTVACFCALVVKHLQCTLSLICYWQERLTMPIVNGA